jgi:hypothetical protein
MANISQFNIYENDISPINGEPKLALASQKYLSFET